MNAMRFWSVCAAILGAALVVGSARPALADDLKIGLCDPMKVAGDCAEGKDLKNKLKADEESYKNTSAEKANKLKAMKDDMDATLTPDSPAYAEKNHALQSAAIEYKVWQQITEQDLVRKRNIGVKKLYDDIETATAQVAQQKGLTMVIADRKVDKFPADLGTVDPQQLEAALLQRAVLYSDAKVDITGDVTLAMDRDYAK